MAALSLRETLFPRKFAHRNVPSLVFTTPVPRNRGEPLARGSTRGSVVDEGMKEILFDEVVIKPEGYPKWLKEAYEKEISLKQRDFPRIGKILPVLEMGR
jgi:hypothetical protein